MEPGLAAAAYAAESTVEGAVAAGLVISRATAPLNARCQRIPSPSSLLKRSSHTLNVIRGRAYIFGGEGEGAQAGAGEADNAMHVVTLPTDLDLMDTDYQKIPARMSEQQPALDPNSSMATRPSGDVPSARAGHCATVIGERIYICGGRPPANQPSLSQTMLSSPLDEGGKVYVFDTATRTWMVLEANREGSTQGLPHPRTFASSTSIINPLPLKNISSGSRKQNSSMMTDEARIEALAQQEGETLMATDEQDLQAYGTIIMHGGYDGDGNLLRDLWAFDVASRVWARLPDLPETDVAAGEGQICCTQNRIWRCGDDHGQVSHIDVEVDRFDDMSGKGELGISPKADGWQVHPAAVKPNSEAGEAVSTPPQAEEKPSDNSQQNKSLSISSPPYPPLRRRANLVRTTTGQGRDFLILVMGEDPSSGAPLDDVWSFQIRSEELSAAALKDSVRSMVGKSTGVERWAKVNIPEATKDHGVLDLPRGLTRFGSSAGADSNFSIVIWGGLQADGQLNGDGWILTLE